MVTIVGQSSVLRGHISKTKQDRSIVTTEYYIEVGIADFVCAFKSSPRRRRGYILVLNTNYGADVNTASVRLGVRPQLL